MSAKVRVLLLFPDSSEIRWVSKVPAPGARVRSSGGSVWTVAESVQSGVETYTVVCVARSEYRRQARERSGAAATVADDLLVRAREKAESAQRRWQYWRSWRSPFS